MADKVVRPIRDATPEARHQHWFDVVESLEQTHGTRFLPEREGRPYKTSARVFADWCANLIEALNGIYREEAKDDTMKVEDPEVDPRARAVFLLTQCIEFMNENGDRLGESFFEIHRHHDRLNRAPFTSLDDEIFEHLVAMTFMLHECDPGPHQAWNDGDLQNNEAFERGFKGFLELADEPRENNSTRRHSIRQSQARLERAFESLHLSKLLAESKLGGELAPDEQAGVKEATKKRDAPAAGERRRRKRACLANDYTMTLANADDDITLIQALAGLRDRDDLPDSERIVTPTFRYRAAIFQRYLRTISGELKVIHGAYYAPGAPPGKVTERNRLLEDLALGINHARGEALRLRDSKSPANIENARIVAVKIQYMRSLYMKLLLSTEPPGSEEQIRQALIDRIDDWVFHEEAWVESDRKGMERANLTPTSTAKKQEEKKTKREKEEKKTKREKEAKSTKEGENGTREKQSGRPPTELVYSAGFCDRFCDRFCLARVSSGMRSPNGDASPGKGQSQKKPIVGG
ncbi:hypothetical protein DL771_000779 [Monosporascus sp. 5C6A]|nr:hypothetical protein DL771_000779 [Monosporascus sp. 5C6A]